MPRGARRPGRLQRGPLLPRRRRRRGHARPHPRPRWSPAATSSSCTGAAGRPRRRATPRRPTGCCVPGPSSPPSSSTSTTGSCCSCCGAGDRARVHAGPTGHGRRRRRPGPRRAGPDRPVPAAACAAPSPSVPDGVDHRGGGGARPLHGRDPGAGRRRARRLARGDDPDGASDGADRTVADDRACRVGRPACVAAGSAHCATSACARVLDRLSGHPAAGTWLLSTDADTTVPPDWVRAHLRHAADGVHAVAGLADLATTDHLAAGALWRYRAIVEHGLHGTHAPPRLRREPRRPRRRVPGGRRLPAPTARGRTTGCGSASPPPATRWRSPSASGCGRARGCAAGPTEGWPASCARCTCDDHQAGHRAGDALCDGA